MGLRDHTRYSLDEQLSLLRPAPRAVITGVYTDTRYDVTLEGKDYSVRHRTWPATRWQAAGERWAVLGRQGIHRATRECDPEKETYKRVLAALRDALREG